MKTPQLVAIIVLSVALAALASGLTALSVAWARSVKCGVVCPDCPPCPEVEGSGSALLPPADRYRLVYDTEPAADAAPSPSLPPLPMVPPSQAQPTYVVMSPPPEQEQYPIPPPARFDTPTDTQPMDFMEPVSPPPATMPRTDFSFF